MYKNELTLGILAFLVSVLFGLTLDTFYLFATPSLLAVIGYVAYKSWVSKKDIKRKETIGVIVIMLPFVVFGLILSDLIV